ncbi:MAG: cell division protein FtsA [Hyphomicrobiales bacterium]|nr:cell division protein FtsA [Hyphomicrobiales bacterium]MCP5371217.1 cell division protein FtsA [Hyphomicrobiales bacterium]
MRKGGVQSKTRTGVIAALDIGTSKMCCLIARAGGAAGLRVTGIGHQVSHGVRAGAIVSLDEAEAAVRATVEAAEQMAGEQIKQVVVNLSAGHPRSRLHAYDVSVAGHQITDADLGRILAPSELPLDDDGDDGDGTGERELVHAIPVGYTIDGNRGVHDPRGLYGQRLGVHLHIVSAERSAVRNLATCINRCHLDIEAKVISPYAAALAGLVEDETQLGVTLIDMGGGTTSIAVFFDGELVHTDLIPVGGAHVTNDIAMGLSTPRSHAERLKTLYGSVLPSPSDDREVLKVPLMGEEADGETSQVPRSMLVGIMRPRLEETFEMVRARLEEAGFDQAVGRHVVLTGGASQIPGLRELAGQTLDKQVRLARPQPVEGLAEAASGPAFATCVGLLRYAVQQPAEAVQTAARPMEEPNGRFGRIGQWIRENF